MAAKPRKPFLLRVSPEVLAAVERLAAAELRSTNAEIEILLREALARRGVKPGGGGGVQEAPLAPSFDRRG